MGSTLLLVPKRTNLRVQRHGEGRRVKDTCGHQCGERTQDESLPPNIACLSCTATGPPECANAGQYMLGCESWKCLQLPHAFSSERHFLRCAEKTRVGVMVMQRLMEMSCWDSALYYEAIRPSTNVHCGPSDNIQDVGPVLPNKHNNSSDAVGFQISNMKNTVVQVQSEILHLLEGYPEPGSHNLIHFSIFNLPVTCQ